MLDLNGDREFNLYGPHYTERFYVGKYLKTGKQFYDLGVAPDGGSLTLSESTAPLGVIQTPHKGPFTVLLGGENGLLVLDSKDYTLEAPCGKYSLYRADFGEQDSNRGNAWKLSGSIGANAPAIEVSSDATAELVFGPPLRVKLKQSQPKASKSRTFEIMITGQAGERYRVSKGRNDGPAPKMKVVKEGSSEEPAVYNFSYG